ncbi:MAG: murein L,D-transpeptidase catalytic domain family protein [Flavisolibacter sp.]|nr:murein L,D-transpeptidase catalytic domain family protein [Flavisolibacter sp.]
MRKIYFPLSIFCLLATFLLLPVVKAGNNSAIAASPAEIITEISEEKEFSAAVAATVLYDSMKLDKLGMSKEAMVYAFTGYQKLVASGQLKKSSVLTVIDFSQRSDKKRMYIIDVDNFKVLINTFVAHGKNTGLQYAEKFSNTHESLQSSLGFYITKGIYFGKHGRSLKLGGVEKEFNDNAEARAVVVHGATYIGAHRLGAPYMGRSFGCPAVPQELANTVIDIIKDGTCMFIYHPSPKYIKGSKLLNA